MTRMDIPDAISVPTSVLSWWATVTFLLIVKITTDAGYVRRLRQFLIHQQNMIDYLLARARTSHSTDTIPTQNLGMDRE